MNFGHGKNYSVSFRVLFKPVFNWKGERAPIKNLYIHKVTHTESGIPQNTHLSNLPGRSNAGSIRSGLEVAASTKTLSSFSTPSSCVSSWLTTLSVTPVLSWPLFGARASNSSKKRIQGLALWALKDKKLSRENQSIKTISNHTLLKRRETK